MTKTDKRTKTQGLFIGYDEAFGEVKSDLNRILSTSPFIIREYMEHLSLSSGKLIRAASLLACALNDKDLIHRDAIKLASAIELIHLATLVHDDIIDNAEIRRGQASLQSKYGRRTAVICGDYLLCIALKTAATVEDKDSYVKGSIPDYMSKVCLGELNQHINNGNFNLSVYGYLKIIAGKTAALFEASFHGGALLAGGDKYFIKKHARLGKYIGMIFQLTDDCMDYEASQQTARKPVKSDYEQNVITLPLIYAFRKIETFKARAMAGKVSKGEIDRLVKNSGGLVYARSIAKRYHDKSLKIIDGMTLSDIKKEKLISILHRAYRVF